MVSFTISREDLMPTFMMSLNWTNQGIRAVKDSPKRSEAARELAKKVGVEIKHLYLTSGDSDLVIFVDAVTMSLNSHWRLAHLGMCAPALFAHGQQMNIGSSFPSYLKLLQSGDIGVNFRPEFTTSH